MSREIGYLVDMLESAKRAMRHASGKSWDQFISEASLQDAVIYRVQIVGEAARYVSNEVRAEIPQLPWHQITSMRHILVHDYDDVDVSVVWNVVQQDLPLLVQVIESYLESKGIRRDEDGPE